MKFAEGFLTGMILTIVGGVAFKFLFPKCSEEMCDATQRISKDMEKDIKNMK